MNVAETILQQLGGPKFIAMIGVSHFVSDGNSLRMKLARNASKANHLTITLDETTDTYKMRFFYYRMGHFNLKTEKWLSDVEREIAAFEGVYADNLQQIYANTTHMDMHL